MQETRSRFTSALAKVEVDAFVARVLFYVSLSCAAVGALLVVFQYERLSREAIIGILSVPTGVGLSVAAGAWLARRGRLIAGVLSWIAGVYASSSAFALLTGIGVHSIVLGFYGVIVIIAGGAIGARAAVVTGVVCGASVLAMYAAEVAGVLPGQRAIASMPLATRVAAQLLILFAAGAFGVMLSRALLASLRAAREQERRFAGLLAIAADWYWEQDAELRYTHLSDGVERVLGAPPSRFIGRRCEELVDTAELGEAWLKHVETLRARRPFKDFVVRRRTADGRDVYVSMSGEPVFDAAGRFAGYWGTGRDVSDELHARREIEASERRFRDLFELLPSAVIVHRDGVVLRVNAAAAELFGYDGPAAMTGISVFDLNHPSSVELSRRRIALIRRLAPGEVLQAPAELHMRHRSGSDLFVQAVGARIDLPDGDAVLSIYFDVTERRRNDAKLRYSEAMLSRLFEVSPDYMTVSELESGRLVLVNDGFTRMTGWTRDEALGRTTLELGIWFDAEHRSRVVDEMALSGVARDVPVTLRRRDGSLVWALVSCSGFALDGATYCVAVARDITRTERERLEYQAILGNASIGIAVTRDGAFGHVNAALERMFGWPAGALVNRPVESIWRADVWRDLIARAQPLLARGEPVDLEQRVWRRDGTPFWVRVRGGVIDQANPLGGGTVWIVEDITERREFERRLAEAKEQAEAASRAKSEFLANTSHEIRTPLNGLVGLARLALDTGTAPERQREYLRLILDSGQALSAIISDILDLSKIEAGKLLLESSAFDLHELLASVHESHRELAAGRPLALELRLQPGTPRWVRGDPMRVRQIVANFMSNALKFTATGEIVLYAEALPAGGVKIGVIDTGIGVDSAAQQRLFEPFVQADASTTRRFGGTGLGLSICRQLAQLMGGRVGMRSGVGQGSDFWVELPLAVAESPCVEPGAGSDGARALAGAHVLVVEDNAVNLMIAEALLTGWGARVTSVADGRAAIEAVHAADTRGERFDALLMDMHMPVMSGYDATAELRSRYGPQELPIIALTAAALMSERKRCFALGVNDFLTKPLDADRLLQTLLRWTRRPLPALPPA